MKPPSHQRGLTLVELLITIALIGILSTIGMVGYSNYINNAHEIDAQSALLSIYLIQLDYRADTGGYWPTPGGAACTDDDCRAEINAGLFNGVETLRPGTPFQYQLLSTPSASTAPTGFVACAHNPTSGHRYRIDHNSVLSEPASCP